MPRRGSGLVPVCEHLVHELLRLPLAVESGWIVYLHVNRGRLRLELRDLGHLHYRSVLEAQANA